jgi:hypothetical protein
MKLEDLRARLRRQNEVSESAPEQVKPNWDPERCYVMVGFDSRISCWLARCGACRALTEIGRFDTELATCQTCGTKLVEHPDLSAHGEPRWRAHRSHKSP